MGVAPGSVKLVSRDRGEIRSIKWFIVGVTLVILAPLI